MGRRADQNAEEERHRLCSCEGFAPRLARYALDLGGEWKLVRRVARIGFVAGSASPIGGLVKPRTRKQLARAILRKRANASHREGNDCDD